MVGKLRLLRYKTECIAFIYCNTMWTKSRKMAPFLPPGKYLNFSSCFLFNAEH